MRTESLHCGKNDMKDKCVRDHLFHMIAVGLFGRNKMRALKTRCVLHFTTSTGTEQKAASVRVFHSSKVNQVLLSTDNSVSVVTVVWKKVNTAGFIEQI